MSTLARSPLAPAVLEVPAPVPGVRFATMAAGLRYRERHDLTLMEVPDGSRVAGVFTRSATAGHPVQWCRRILRRGAIRAILVNAGNANVFRAEEGDLAVVAEAAAVADTLGCDAESVFIASTGVIGERLPVEKIVEQVPVLVRMLGDSDAIAAAEAIRTTDTFAKWASATTSIGGVPVTITGIVKGSGMIAPDMATMLGFMFTDAKLPSEVMQTLLEEAVDGSFNAITVDGDTSTSDTVLLAATGQADHAAITSADATELKAFREALARVSLELAHLVIRDGEGAQKFIAIEVRGAVSNLSARRIALTIANSPLVKTAFAGGDANWGRIVMAVGKAEEPIDGGAIYVSFGGHMVARNGGAVPDLDENPVNDHLAGRNVEVVVGVGDGPGVATVWTCDLTHGYIDINADYRS